MRDESAWVSKCCLVSVLGLCFFATFAREGDELGSALEARSAARTVRPGCHRIPPARRTLRRNSKHPKMNTGITALNATIDLDEHVMVFIGGAHGSGTSLMAQVLRDRPGFSVLHGTGKPEDEGQHVQDVYKPANKCGGRCEFGSNTESYLDETSHADGDERKRMFDAWGPYWNLTNQYLVEKSPPNIVRARFLQSASGGWRSRFVMHIRHPMDEAHKCYKVKNVYRGRQANRTTWPAKPRHLGQYLESWLDMYERLEADAPSLCSAYVVRFETWLKTGDESGHALVEKLVPLLQAGRSSGRRRRLEFHGDRNASFHIAAWDPADRHLPLLPEGHALVQKYEARVARFGYSLTHDRVDGDVLPEGLRELQVRP